MMFPIDVQVTTDAKVKPSTATYKILTTLTFECVTPNSINALKDIIQRNTPHFNLMILDHSYDRDSEALKVRVIVEETIDDEEVQRLIETEIRNLSWGVHAIAANISSIDKEVKELNE